ncbi:transposase [Streptomyces sp. NPDC047706]|uniref:transposase n=1 Tax=Streptomyces sp. NPDC047706 TaxID=3365486 RepID=UPI00371F28C0
MPQKRSGPVTKSRAWSCEAAPEIECMPNRCEEGKHTDARPKRWGVAVRGGVRPEAGHREKWRLTLDMLDTLADWGMSPPLVVADAAYGTKAHLRTGLAQRGIGYVLAVRGEVRAHPFDAEPVTPDRCVPQPRYRRRAPSVAALTGNTDTAAGRRTQENCSLPPDTPRKYETRLFL